VPLGTEAGPTIIPGVVREPVIAHERELWPLEILQPFPAETLIVPLVGAVQEKSTTTDLIPWPDMIAPLVEPVPV